MLPQSATKMTKRAVRNLAVCCGAIWRCRENRNMGAKLQSLPCTSPSLKWHTVSSGMLNSTIPYHTPVHLSPKIFLKMYFLH